MQRRELLAGAGALAAGVLAGCLASAPGDDGTPTPTSTPTPTLADSTFSVEEVTSGTGENAASVSFGDPVVVEGTIDGNNGCYTASLDAAAYADGTLTVVVRAHKKDDAGMCTEALVDIDYRATFAFAGGSPDRVVVVHRSDGERRTVATATR